MTMLSNIYLILTGFGLGLLFSAPVGPVNVLCIQHSLERGFWAGLAIGLGALVADMMIATTAALGITVISGLMKSYEIPVQIGGGIILIGFGLRLIFSHPMIATSSAGPRSFIGHLGGMPQSFLLTVTNPGAIFGIFAVVGSAGSAVGGLATFAEAFLLLAGVAGGALLWWIGLAKLTASFRHKLNLRRLQLINRCAGGLLGFCGVALIANALYSGLLNFLH